MADRLTAAEMADFTGRNIRNLVTRTLEFTRTDGAIVTVFSVTEKVVSWGRIKTAAYNREPQDRGTFLIPTSDVLVDNSDGDFDMGGPIFPGGRSTLSQYTAQLVVTIGTRTFIDFTGLIPEPSYSDSKQLTLTIEHPLAPATSQKWGRDDRYGGDTGIDAFFV